MNQRLESLTELFTRDLNRLKTEIKQVKDEHLWEKSDGITNSCGVLSQHITGNLLHYIGYALGNTGYIRDRDKEFTRTGISKEQIIEGIDDASSMIQDVIKDLDEDQLDTEYPLDSPTKYTTYQFLVHLYGHLNYHLGQVNYLRRILDENKG